MKKALIVFLLATSFAACTAARQAKVHDKLDSYLNKPVSELALVLGPPTTQFATGNRQMAFQWEHYDEAYSPGIAVPVGNSLIYSAPHSQQRECRVSVVALTSSPNPNQGDWIIKSWRYNGNGCV
jgi:hypothetical protein